MPLYGVPYRKVSKLESFDFAVPVTGTSAVLPVDDFATEIFVQALDGDIEIQNSGATANVLVKNGQTLILDDVASTLILSNPSAAIVNVRITRKTLR